MGPQADRPEPPQPLQVHVLPPPVRTRVLRELRPPERRLVSLLCCSCATLDRAAEVLEVPADEARAMWRRVLALVAEQQRPG